MTAPDASAAAAGASGPGPVILVVDDQAATRTLLCKTVKSIYPSAQLHEASDGEAALRFAKAIRPALVLLDIVLPGSDVSGVFICQELAKARIPVLIVSGNATGPILDACLAMGAAGFLRKPFTVEDAQAKIKACIGD